MSNLRNEYLENFFEIERTKKKYFSEISLNESEGIVNYTSEIHKLGLKLNELESKRAKIIKKNPLQ